MWHIWAYINYHVPEIECHNSTVKEMAIYMPGLVYFKKLQVRISAAIISNDMFWLKY